MAIIDKLWLATRTRDKDDAGTDAKLLNLTVNVDGEDLLDIHFPFMRASGGNLGPDSGWLGRAQAAISDPGAGAFSGLRPSPSSQAVPVSSRHAQAWHPPFA